MIHDIGKVNLGKPLCIDENGRTRKHSLCLKIRRHVNSNIGLNYFTGRVNYWNHLTDVVVSCSSLNTFKIKAEFVTAKGEFKFIVQLMHD